MLILALPCVRPVHVAGAPEQDYKRCGRNSDMWSFGVLVLRVCTGQEREAYHGGKSERLITALMMQV